MSGRKDGERTETEKFQWYGYSCRNKKRNGRDFWRSWRNYPVGWVDGDHQAVLSCWEKRDWPLSIEEIERAMDAFGVMQIYSISWTGVWRTFDSTPVIPGVDLSKNNFFRRALSWIPLRWTLRICWETMNEIGKPLFDAINRCLERVGQQYWEWY